MSVIQPDQKHILELQKELMSAILDYQIAHGPESVLGWNVSIAFPHFNEKK